MRRQSAGNPEQVCENDQRERQMCCQSILTDINPINQARRHHPPADKALQSAEYQSDHQSGLQPRLDTACSPERNHWHKEGNADEPAKQPVPPFPPEDELELVQAHPLVDQLVLGDLLILFKFLLPILC